jgi:hypothetical protein
MKAEIEAKSNPSILIITVLREVLRTIGWITWKSRTWLQL